jgi:hypothetical protein
LSCRIDQNCGSCRFDFVHFIFNSIDYSLSYRFWLSIRSL